MASIVCGLLIIVPNFRSLYILTVIALGSITGYLILPFFLSKDARKPFISFLGSCLSTLVTSLLWFTIYAVSQYHTYANSNDGIGDLPEGLFFVFVFVGFITFVAAPTIGFLTTLFDKWLFNRRQRKDPVNPEVFD